MKLKQAKKNKQKIHNIMTSQITALKVGDGIISGSSTWEFNNQVAPKFNGHIIKSVPYYLDTQVAVAELSDWFVRKNSKVLDLGCATGSTMADILKRHAGKDIQATGIDNSSPMLEEAEKTLNGLRNYKLSKSDLESYDFPTGNDMICSLYTLQFVHPQYRNSICRKIYESLNYSGGFILVEKVLDTDSQLAEIFQSLHWQRKELNGLGVEEIYGKAKSLRGVMIPLSVEKNLEMLRLAGFSKVGLFFKFLNFAGILAIK